MSFLDGIFAGSPDDPRYAANMALFGAMMKGDFAGGVQAHAQALAQGRDAALRRQIAQQQLESGNMTLDEQRRKLADEAASRATLQEFYRMRGMPGAPQGAPGAAPGALGDAMPGPAGPGGPGAGPGALGDAMPPAAAALAPAQSSGVTPKAEIWKQYTTLADMLSAKGLVSQAQQYYALAEKMRPKFGTEPRTMMGPDGKLVNVLVGEDGTTQVLPFGVKPNMKLQDLGGKVVAVDENTVQNGAQFGKTQTPDSIASNAVAWANNALTRRGQDMTDQRSREQLNAGKVPAGYRFKADGSGLEFIPGGPADPNAAKRAAPTEWQGKSAMFGARAQEADKILSGLTGQYSPAGVNFKSAVGNTPLIGGALEAGANMALSDNSQKAEQSQRDFVNAVLRLESGAAISQSEFENARKQYFPQPGDSGAVIQQKARNRQLAIQGLMSNARPGQVDHMTAGGASGGWSIQKVE